MKAASLPPSYLSYSGCYYDYYYSVVVVFLVRLVCLVLFLVLVLVLDLFLLMPIMLMVQEDSAVVATVETDSSDAVVRWTILTIMLLLLLRWW